MANRYYSEFDFYRRLLHIIDNPNLCYDKKLGSIKCAINQQFYHFDKMIKSHRVTVCENGRRVCYAD